MLGENWCRRTRPGLSRNVASERRAGVARLDTRLEHGQRKRVRQLPRHWQRDYYVSGNDALQRAKYVEGYASVWSIYAA